MIFLKLNPFKNYCKYYNLFEIKNSLAKQVTHKASSSLLAKRQKY